MTCPATTSEGWPCRSYMACRKNGSMTIIMQNAAALLLTVRLSKSSRLGNGRSSSISVHSHTTHRAVRQWAIQSYSRPNMICCLFSFPLPCEPSYVLIIQTMVTPWPGCPSDCHMEHTFESANRIVRSFPLSRYYDLC